MCMPTGQYTRTKEHGLKISKGLKKIGHRPPIGLLDKSSNWKGGRIKRSGYWYLKIPDHPFSGKQGYIAEHRIIMEQKIGRYLKKEETVHHIDHNQTNNDISNLILCETRGSHTTLYHPEIRIKSSIANKGKRRSIKTEFKKGMIPWNKKK